MHREEINLSMRDMEDTRRCKRFFLVFIVTIISVTALIMLINGFKSKAYAVGTDVEEFAFTDTIKTIIAGDKYNFKAEGNTEAIRWSVSDKKYAIVSQKGVFTAKSPGKVTLYAADADKIISCKVEIQGKKKITIDAGHQLKGNSSLEPVGPGASEKKAKVSSGTAGASSGVPEYKLTLNIAKKLRKELLARGYDVYMIRTKNNVNISNKKRALNANKSGSDIYIRIHADSSASSSVTGASALYPSKSNPYVGNLSKSSLKLSKAVIDEYCEATGIKNRGCVVRDDLTGTNWSKIPVTLIEMGFMSNASEDKKMQKSSFQKKMVNGMADGIDEYFGY